jgi:hypothetical protein
MLKAIYSAVIYFCTETCSEPSITILFISQHHIPLIMTRLRSGNQDFKDWSVPLVELVYTNIDGRTPFKEIFRRCQKDDRVSDVEKSVANGLGVQDYELETEMVRSALDELVDMGALERGVVVEDSDNPTGPVRSEEGQGSQIQTYYEQPTGSLTLIEKLTGTSDILASEPEESSIRDSGTETPSDEQGFSKGDIVNGSYELQKRLGSGISGTYGMTSVWKASDRDTDDTVVVKFGFGDFSVFLQREQSILQKIEEEGGHENIVPLKEVTEVQHPLTEEEGMALIREYVQGNTLEQRERRLGTDWFDQEMVYKIGLQLADALGVCHNNDIIIRGLRPTGIVLKDSGLTPVIVDFDLGFDLVEDPDAGEEAVCGYAYPPEVIDPSSTKRKPAGHSDTYTLGVILFQMITRVPPPDSTEGLNPNHFGVDINVDFAQIIERATKPDPEDRFPTGTAMKKELDFWVSFED